jgi:hypothetical protein
MGYMNFQAQYSNTLSNRSPYQTEVVNVPLYGMEISNILMEFIMEALLLICTDTLMKGIHGASASCPTTAIQFTISYSLSMHTHHYHKTEK